MRIASFISSASDTADFEFQWKKCPAGVELESGKRLVIERPKWKIFVFNGRNDFYCNRDNYCWRYSNLVEGLKEIFLSHKTAEFAVLFHAIPEDIEDLKKLLSDGLEKTNVDSDRIHFLGYHSGEDLYGKIICKFKNEKNLDQLFDDLWLEIKKISVSKTVSMVQNLRYQILTPLVALDLINQAEGEEKIQAVDSTNPKNAIVKIMDDPSRPIDRLCELLAIDLLKDDLESLVRKAASSMHIEHHKLENVADRINQGLARLENL